MNKGNLYLVQNGNEQNGVQMFDLSNYNAEQLQLLQEMIVVQRMNLLAQQIQEVKGQIEETKDNVIKLERRYEIEREETKKEIAKITDLMVSRFAAREHKIGWVTLTDFGAQFYVPISCRRVGKLFRVIGIAQKRNKTRPKFEYVGDEKLATTMLLNNGRSTYVWNYRRVLNHLNLWLEKHGHLHEFYSKKTVDEMHAFIDWLHDVYVGEVA
mgnify:CR=1 FL=1